MRCDCAPILKNFCSGQRSLHQVSISNSLLTAQGRQGEVYPQDAHLGQPASASALPARQIQRRQKRTHPGPKQTHPPRNRPILSLILCEKGPGPKSRPLPRITRYANDDGHLRPIPPVSHFATGSTPRLSRECDEQKRVRNAGCGTDQGICSGSRHLTGDNPCHTMASFDILLYL